MLKDNKQSQVASQTLNELKSAGFNLCSSENLLTNTMKKKKENKEKGIKSKLPLRIVYIRYRHEKARYQFESYTMCNLNYSKSQIKKGHRSEDAHAESEKEKKK